MGDLLCSCPETLGSLNTKNGQDQELGNFSLTPPCDKTVYRGVQEATMTDTDGGEQQPSRYLGRLSLTKSDGSMRFFNIKRSILIGRGMIFTAEHVSMDLDIFLDILLR